MGSKMKRIVITGGIGSGKSSVCSYLENKGFIVLYADKVAKSMTQAGGLAIEDIRASFGEKFILPDGSLDIGRMRQLVYSNPDSKKLLEKLTTDRVEPEIKALLTSIEQNENPSAVFIEIPLVYEKNAQDNYDYVWLVVSDLDRRISRIVERDGITATAAQSIIDSQMPDSDKQKLADEVIFNCGTVGEMYRQIDELIVKYTIL